MQPYVDLIRILNRQSWRASERLLRSRQLPCLRALLVAGSKFDLKSAMKTSMIVVGAGEQIELVDVSRGTQDLGVVWIYRVKSCG